MRIVLTCDWFLKYSTQQAAALARAGSRVLLLCRDHAIEFGADEQERAHAIACAQSDGVEVVVIPGRGRDASALGALTRIRRQLRRFAPEVIHAHSGADPRALALLPRAPVVLTLHDPTQHPGQSAGSPLVKRWLRAATDRAWRARASAIVVHSDRLRGMIALGGHQRCAVIPHGLAVNHEPLAPPSLPTVGFFGRLEPYKGLEVLARAMPCVWEKRPDVHLRVTGRGPVTFSLSDSRVHFEPAYLPEARFEAFFRSTSLVVLPYTEASATGAGSTALGYGIPLVVSRVGALPDLALDESYLVDPGSERSLAAAVVRHVDDGPDTRQRVLTQLAGPRSWDSAAALSLQLYEGLACRR
jgi:glycosyltransferase involved in cell wall biosynthesis